MSLSSLCPLRSELETTIECAWGDACVLFLSWVWALQIVFFFDTWEASSFKCNLWLAISKEFAYFFPSKSKEKEEVDRGSLKDKKGTTEPLKVNNQKTIYDDRFSSVAFESMALSSHSTRAWGQPQRHYRYTVFHVSFPLSFFSRLILPFLSRQTEKKNTNCQLESEKIYACLMIWTW